MAQAFGMASWAGAALIALSAMANAQHSPVVVELYTSQGCSSCPPADAFLAELTNRPDVLALALHVDYWDYLGWKDVFAQPGFTDRQKRYARAAGAKMVYTPQIIVGGTDRVKGLRPEEIIARIAAHAALPSSVALTVVRQGTQVLIEAVANPPLSSAALVQLVRYHPQDTVLIERGENAGREVTYHNIVTDWQAVAEWPGLEPLRLQAAAPGNQPLVVIVQEAGPGRVLAAARLD